MPRTVIVFVLLFVGAVHRDVVAAEPALELFQQRIMPIFNSPQPSSCVQCHLAAVDLKDYILPSHEQTFLSLRDQGLIDVAQPNKSKILTLIRMGDEDPDPLAKRIHAKTRQAEYEAFAAWVRACCQDKQLIARAASATQPAARPKPADEVIRHGRKDRVLDSFVRNIWSQRMRCFPCHTPHEIDPDNPNHVKPKQTHRDFVAKYGARMSLFKATPRETMDSLLASSRKRSPKRLPLINLDEPTQSLLLLKPTSKLPPRNDEGGFQDPSSLAPVSHMGGLKMHVNDVSYKAAIAWIEDLASLKRGGYLTQSDLPVDDWQPTQKVLRMKETPESWSTGSTVQLFVYAVGDSDANRRPIAFTQGTVTPRRFVNGPLILLDVRQGQADAGHRPSGRLTPGKYLVRAYLDSAGQLADQPSLLLAEGDYRGQLEFEASWRVGFKNAEVVSGSQLAQ